MNRKHPMYLATMMKIISDHTREGPRPIRILLHQFYSRGGGWLFAAETLQYPCADVEPCRVDAVLGALNILANYLVRAKEKGIEPLFYAEPEKLEKFDFGTTWTRIPKALRLYVKSQTLEIRETKPNKGKTKKRK